MLLVTRPREQAQQWVHELRSRGVSAAALPLLEIESALDMDQRRQAWNRLQDADLVVFVSPNAVAHFFGPGGRSWPASTWAAAPGQGTAAALLKAGVPADLILQPPADSAQFDSESLWPVLAAQPWQGRRALVVRGEGGREWLSDQLLKSGALVDHLRAYGRRPPRLAPDEVAHLKAAWQHPLRAVWLFSSSEAVSHLPGLVERLQSQGHLGPGSWELWARSVPALATHPRIMQQALRLGLARTRACRPSVEDVIAACAEYNPAHREP